MIRELLPYPIRSVAMLKGNAKLGTVSTGLLEEERNAIAQTCVSDIASPCVVHEPMFPFGITEMRSALPSCYDPINAAKIWLSNVLNKRLNGQELNGCSTRSDSVYPGECLSVFDRGAHPDVLGPRTRPLSSAFRALGEYLKSVLRKIGHYSEYMLQIVLGHLLVEKVGHRVNKNAPRLLPFVRLFQLVRFNLKVFYGVIVCPYLFCVAVSPRNGFCIAKTTALGHSAASVGWIPCRICPAYSCFLWHNCLQIKAAPLASLLFRQHMLTPSEPFIGPLPEHCKYKPDNDLWQYIDVKKS